MSISELDDALASGNTELLVGWASTAGGFRHLPADVVSKVMAALDTGKLSDQARRELISILLDHASDLKVAQPLLESWLAHASMDAVAMQKRTFALTVLLSLGFTLPEQDVMAALESSDWAANRAALRYLHNSNGSDSVAATFLNEVARLLTSAKKVPDWAEAYELLRAKSPKFLEGLYGNLPPLSIVKLWPAEVSAEWVRQVPSSA